MAKYDLAYEVKDVQMLHKPHHVKLEMARRDSEENNLHEDAFV